MTSIHKIQYTNYFSTLDALDGEVTDVKALKERINPDLFIELKPYS